MIAPSDLHTESFSNSRGWTIVRVTHLPTGCVAERERSKDLVSSVQAQSECIAELSDRIGSSEGSPALSPGADDVVTRAEFEALAARVAELERPLPSMRQPR